MSEDLFQVPNKPWWWPRSLKFRVILIWVVVFFALMSLQNLKIIASSLKPFVLGLPFSLFFTFLVSLITTAVILLIYFLWQDFIARADQEVNTEGR
ncbi:MAG: hypothetical protein ACYSWR_05000 [Planctomycetota bacterium]|jgi:hypothetical protein